MSKIFIGVFIFGFLVIAVQFLLPAAYLKIVQNWSYRSPPEGCEYISFSAQNVGSKVTCEIVVKRAAIYSVYLAYNYGDKLEKDKAAIASGWTVNAENFKSPLELKVTLHEQAGADLVEKFSKIVIPKPATISGKAFLSTLLGANLSKGSYILTVESLKDAPSLGDLNVSIYFSLSPQG